MSAIVGKNKVGREALEAMKKRGGKWFAYQNHDMGHFDCGAFKFMKCGKGCTYKTPPSRLPDSDVELNWQYVHVGKVDMENGVVI